MAARIVIEPSERRGFERGRPRLGWRADLLSALLGAWLLGGLFVDGWAHQNLRALETFLTPWHALFYSGFLANAAWMSWVAGRERAAVARGYGLGLVGVGVFALGGFGDMLWHVRFGIEQGLEALLSPTHLVLLAGLALILSTPFRAAWRADDPVGAAPPLRAFSPALISLTLTTTLVSFFLAYASAFLNAGLLAEPWDESVELGLSSILLTNLVLLAPALLLLRRWRPPFGSITLLFTAPAFLSSGLVEFEDGSVVAAALLGGLAADCLGRVLRPSPVRIRALRAYAAVVPLVLWGAYVLLVRRDGGLGWSPELSSGIVVLTGMSGVLLSVLMVPTPLDPDSAATGTSVAVPSTATDVSL